MALVQTIDPSQIPVVVCGPIIRCLKWGLSFPIPLRFLLAAHPHLLSPILQVVNRAISTFLIKQAGLKRIEAQTGAVTLIQRFGSAATKSPGAISNSRRLVPTG